MHTAFNTPAALPAVSVRAAGVLALAVGMISAVGVVLLVAMFATFAWPEINPGIPFGWLNDICVALQYALAIPLALMLHQLLFPYNATWIRFATVTGIAGMVAIVLLQAALIFGLLEFEQQVGWVMLAMVGGVAPWLLITAVSARATGKLPGSVGMSIGAAFYFGFPVWAIQLGRRLLEW